MFNYNIKLTHSNNLANPRRGIQSVCNGCIGFLSFRTSSSLCYPCLRYSLFFVLLYSPSPLFKPLQAQIMSICLYSWTVYCIAGLLSEHCNLFRISEGLLNYSACPHIVLILPRFSVIFYYLSVDQSMYCLFCYTFSFQLYILLTLCVKFKNI